MGIQRHLVQSRTQWTEAPSGAGQEISITVPYGACRDQSLSIHLLTCYKQPEDSEHPDRQVHIDVFVETWLTEEEYQEAKDKQVLAWQQSPTRRSSPTETLTDIPVCYMLIIRFIF